MPLGGIENRSPYAAEAVVLGDKEGEDVLVVLVKASYEIVGCNELALADSQSPICLADEYYDEPDGSSMRRACEATFAKAATDIVLTGHAQPPHGKPVKQLDVKLCVGMREKTVRVIGDRVWWRQKLLFKRWRRSSTAPFVRMPLVYERAFGGSDMTPENKKNHVSESRNPVGTGMIASRSRLQQLPLPNLEDPRNLIKSPRDRPRPVGFGFIPGHWEPRKSQAGTYDSEWQITRMPLLPMDFDVRFFNAAHPDLVVEGFLRGDEPVRVINASPRGELAFPLPDDRPTILIKKQDGEGRMAPQLASLFIDTDCHRVELLWHAAEAKMDVHAIESVRVSGGCCDTLSLRAAQMAYPA